jgi:hypothetical protein
MLSLILYIYILHERLNNNNDGGDNIMNALGNKQDSVANNSPVLTIGSHIKQSEGSVNELSMKMISQFSSIFTLLLLFFDSFHFILSFILF